MQTKRRHGFMIAEVRYGIHEVEFISGVWDLVSTKWD